MVKLKGELIGVRELGAALAELGPKVMRPAARRGVVKAVQAIAKDAKARVSVRTRSLRNSIGHKVVAMKSGTGYVGVVGPRRDPRRQPARPRKTPARKFRRQVEYRGRTITVDPAKYAHLVEYGRRAVRTVKKKVLSDGTAVFGRGVRAVAPQPFMRPAWESNRQASLVAVRVELWMALAKAQRGK